MPGIFPWPPPDPFTLSQTVPSLQSAFGLKVQLHVDEANKMPVIMMCGNIWREGLNTARTSGRPKAHPISLESIHPLGVVEDRIGCIFDCGLKYSV